MQVTKAEGYGILGVIHLAEKGVGRIVPLSDIAESEEIPEKFLAKIFQNLTKTGIVRSHRGVKGGFSLLRNPKELTIREVVEAIQGPYHLVVCIPDRERCQKSYNCAVRVVMDEAEKKLLKVFESYTVSDLVKWKKDHPDKRKKVS